MNKPYLYSILLTCLIVGSCKKEDLPEPVTAPISTETPGNIKGMGGSNEYPTGSVFQLQTGISLTTNIISSTNCTSNLDRGSGLFVSICATFHNNTSQNILCVFPTGLIFVADSASQNQSGLLVQETSFIVPANSDTICRFSTYCINAHKLSSYNTQASYKLGPISTNQYILELLNILKDKKINIENYPGPNDGNYLNATDYIQNAVWSITDSTGLTNNNRTQLNSLPAK